MDPYRLAALIVLGLVIAYSLYLYHRRRGEALERRHAVHHGWRKVVLSVRHEVWVCPRCGNVCPTWRDVLRHQSVDSPCATLEDEQVQAAALERDKAAAVDAQAAGRWSAAAVYDNNADTGAVDTFAGELESGRGE